MHLSERTRGRASAVERIAGWTGQVLGTQSLPQYHPGQAGRGEQALHRLNVTTPPQESVLSAGLSTARSRSR